MEAIESRGVGDMEERVLAECGAGSSAIIVVGGDGSVHEAVNGILKSGRPTTFGLIPAGTGNDFAKACGIPLDWQEATRLLARQLAGERSGRPVDAGRMNDRFFANGAGIGFDARSTGLQDDTGCPSATSSTSLQWSKVYSTG